MRLNENILVSGWGDATSQNIDQLSAAALPPINYQSSVIPDGKFQNCTIKLMILPTRQSLKFKKMTTGPVGGDTFPEITTSLYLVSVSVRQRRRQQSSLDERLHGLETLLTQTSLPGHLSHWSPVACPAPLVLLKPCVYLLFWAAQIRSAPSHIWLQPTWYSVSQDQHCLQTFIPSHLYNLPYNFPKSGYFPPNKVN